MIQNLASYIHSPVVAVATYYLDDTSLPFPRAHVCGARVNADNTLVLRISGDHELKVGSLVTLHLDNRTGVAEYDAELSVYRLSYKGRVADKSDTEIIVQPIEFQVFYGISVEYEFREQDYEFPADERAETPLPMSPLTIAPLDDPEEHENKIGVLVTCANQQPHTTVMAFLSSENDDIFFITFPSTFKSKLLKRNNYCLFAIDNRATFTFEHAIQWNFTIISGHAHLIEKNTALFEAIREQFIIKNPWEIGFFSHPEVEMYHITPDKVFVPTDNS